MAVQTFLIVDPATSDQNSGRMKLNNVSKEDFRRYVPYIILWLP